MTGPFVFDVTAIRESAQRIEYALDEVPDSGYTTCTDSGSSLVSETLKLFIDEFTKKLKSEKRNAKRIAEAMEGCADDFDKTESEQVHQVLRFLAILVSR
ncbi:hypothetical protein D9V34_15100 [Mycetocola lacteus]|uniref:Uncharacterized protein n=1 Tax=Mycetocola lacteus TaxID=76637 RepID=A0A3L7AHL3_9MICO|nr:hypothetical protein [Mycetocola lacteus]RLP79869.1 hypothetical protein D9V34_15100 [Mycetocola lacteus]